VRQCSFKVLARSTQIPAGEILRNMGGVKRKAYYEDEMKDVLDMYKRVAR